MEFEFIEIIKKYILQAGFLFADKFSDANMMSISNENVCILSVKGVDFSPRISSADGLVYGAEVEYSVSFKLFGVKGNYSDYDDLNGKIAKLIRLLGFSQDMIAIDLKYLDVVQNHVLSRLEGGISARLKFFVMTEEE